MAHAGIVMRCTTTPVCFPAGTSGAASRASIALSAARPRPSRRCRETAAFADGPRSPLAWISTAAMPAELSAPCSPTVSEKARWASCPKVLGEPGSEPASRASASLTVRWSTAGAEPKPSE